MVSKKIYKIAGGKNVIFIVLVLLAIIADMDPLAG